MTRKHGPRQVEVDDMLLGFLWKLCKDYGKFSCGTYDKRDPTHFENVSADFWMQYGFGCDEEYPAPEKVEVTMQDVTWGVHVRIHSLSAEIILYKDKVGKRSRVKVFRPPSSVFPKHRCWQDIVKDLVLNGVNKACWDEMSDELPPDEEEKRYNASVKVFDS